LAVRAELSGVGRFGSQISPDTRSLLTIGRRTRDLFSMRRFSKGEPVVGGNIVDLLGKRFDWEAYPI
jgi:hypothetical protein